MKSVTTAAAAGLAAMLTFAAPASAAEIRLLSTNALKTSLEDIVPQFEKASEHKVVFVWGPAANLKTQIEKGEAFDATILTNAGIDDLVKQGKLDGATRTPLARSGIGVAVRKGASRPDISTTDAFKRALLSAKFDHLCRAGRERHLSEGLVRAAWHRRRDQAQAQARAHGRR